MNPIYQAMHAIAGGAGAAAANPDRPLSHFMPPSRWMNDPNGTIFHDGWYHLFYQLHPFGDAWGSMHWGHARSRDLVDWEHLPIALAPSAELGEEHCYSGCVAIDRTGRPKLLYTSVAPKGGRPFQQWSATGDADLVSWTRDTINPLIPTNQSGEPSFGSDARDPYIFHDQGRIWLIFGAIIGDESVVPLYEAIDGDLERWRYHGILYREPRTSLPFPECPNLLSINGRWLLVMSPYRPVEWRLGDLIDGQLTVECQGRLDQHDAFYATNTLTDAAGRTVVLGWVRGFRGGTGWSGCLAHPRLLELDERSGIRQRLHPCLELLRDGEPLVWAGTVADQQTLGDCGDTVEVRGTLRCADGSVIALHLGAVAGSPGVVVCWNGTSLIIDGHTYPVATTSLEVDLHIICDRTVCEIFADGGRTVITRVVYRTDRGGQAWLSGRGQADLSIQRLRPCRFSSWPV